MLEITGTPEFIKGRAHLVVTRIRNMSQVGNIELSAVDAMTMVKRIEMLEAIEDMSEERAAWCNLAHAAGAEIGGYGHMWDDECGLVARAKKLKAQVKEAEEWKVAAKQHQKSASYLASELEEKTQLANDLQLICLNDLPDAPVKLKAAQDRIKDLEETVRVLNDTLLESAES